jgi:hypothetical protein
MCAFLFSPMLATCPDHLLRWVHVMKFVIVQFSLPSSYFINLGSRFSPHHPVLKDAQPNGHYIQDHQHRCVIPKVPGLNKTYYILHSSVYGLE